MKQVVRSPSRLEGTIVLPGDRSIAHRAVLLNSIANGTATVTNYATGADGVSMVRCLRALGASIKRLHPDDRSLPADSFLVGGRGPHGLEEPPTVLNAGNSGATMRQVAGLLAAQPFFGVISGDRSLRSRPMSRVVQPLTQMGAQIIGRGQSSLAPLAIRGGGLRGIDYTLPVASAQLKSCILIAGLYARGETAILQPAESRDHTERMLRSMGAGIEVDGLHIGLRPSELSPMDVSVPGDFSAAAFWLVAACCHPDARIRINGVGINPTRTGALDVLKAMGARITLENVREDQAEPVADIVAESSDLRSTAIGGDTIPRVMDELPVLALAACVARGTTVIRDAAELRVKESDRIAATAKGLSNLGARVEERPDGMVIHGGASLVGAECESFGDHRIAMAMAVAGLLARGETAISGAEAASVSYPDFWETVSDLTREALTGRPATES